MYAHNININAWQIKREKKKNWGGGGGGGGKGMTTSFLCCALNMVGSVFFHV